MTGSCSTKDDLGESSENTEAESRAAKNVTYNIMEPMEALNNLSQKGERYGRKRELPLGRSTAKKHSVHVQMYCRRLKDKWPKRSCAQIILAKNRVKVE